MRISFPRWAANTLVLLVCFLLILHVYGLEAFVVPTGSMAPALAGHHRACACPRCGYRVLVGRHGNDADADELGYQQGACPNCGGSLHLHGIAEATGDHILVNKSVFLFRRPRRWEIVVFRLFGKVFVKRIIGLPGEWILVEDGDIFIDNDLARKTLAEFKQVRMPVFDNRFLPDSPGWRPRWDPDGPAQAFVINRSLTLRGSDDPRSWRWLTHQNYSLDQGKVSPLCDEYAYNGGNPPAGEPVHDFMLEGDLEVTAGVGQIALAITDGRDSLTVQLPVATLGPARLLRKNEEALPPAEGTEIARSDYRLLAGKTCHVELAFVDRRLTLAIDGQEVFRPADLERTTDRQPVARPVCLGVRGVDAVFRNVRLYRDLHYTQAGRQAVQGKAVHLEAGQYFVMGDNSPNSEDSRFWPGEGKVPAASLIGKPFLLHLPSRVVSTYRFGRVWQYQLPDWERVRWLH